MNLFHHLKLFIISHLLLFQFQNNGVSAAGLCRKESNDDYKCGSHTGDLPIWLATCTNNKCCCNVEDGWNGKAHYQSNSCDNQASANIGCFACSGSRACQWVTNIDIGDSSCTGYNACKYAGDSDSTKGRTRIGIGSCHGKYACDSVHGTIGDGSCNSSDDNGACKTAKGVTIGDNSCNADAVCRDCEAGSVVPDGTCNDLWNADEVGQVYLWYALGDGMRSRCRACFAELRQGDYAVEVVARAMAKYDAYCSSLAQEMKEHVVESLSSHKRFVRFLEDKDLSKKCRKEYLSNAVGVIHDEGIFDQGCKLTIKMNAKLELLKEDVPDFETSFKEAVGDGLPMDNIFVDGVMATKMNCEGSSPGPGGKSKKGKSTKSKEGKRGKK